MKKTVIFGCKGMLGRQISEESFPNKILSTADITNYDEIEKIIDKDVGTVINCVAYTDVEKAETEKEKAHAVNIIGPKNLAMRCNIVGAKLVHFSSDYVYGNNIGDLNTDDLGNQLNYYGFTKRAGELNITDISFNYLIIRTSALYAPWGNNFFLKILKKAKETTDYKIRVVDDIITRPTSVFGLAKATQELVELDVRGVFEVSGGGSCSWAKFARRIISKCQLNCDVVFCLSEDFPSVKRPKNILLDNSLINELLGPRKHWTVELDEVIEKYYWKNYHIKREIDKMLEKYDNFPIKSL